MSSLSSLIGTGNWSEVCLEDCTEEDTEFEAEEGSEVVELIAENRLERGGTGESAILSFIRFAVVFVGEE